MQEIKSMTAFGEAEFSYKNWLIKVEISSVNGKYADIKFRTPKGWQQQEQEWRKMLLKRIGRGTVQVALNIEEIAGMEEKPRALLNTSLFNNYISQLRSVTEPHELDASTLLPFVMQQPGVLQGPEEEELNAIYKHVNTCIANAFNQFDKNRMEEGASIANQLQGNIDKIDSLALRVSQLEEQRVNNLKERMMDKIKEWNSELEVDPSRLEQEFLFYLDKWDITEEKTRLEQHCNFFRSTLANNPSGKKIAFIAQELGREITTMGNKANFFELQKLTVEMKEELEKIKEQAFNLL